MIYAVYLSEHAGEPFKLRALAFNSRAAAEDAKRKWESARRRSNKPEEVETIVRSYVDANYAPKELRRDPPRVKCQGCGRLVEPYQAGKVEPWGEALNYSSGWRCQKCLGSSSE